MKYSLPFHDNPMYIYFLLCAAEMCSVCLNTRISSRMRTKLAVTANSVGGVMQ